MLNIVFDPNHNAQQPTLVLATRSGNKLGVLDTIDDLVTTDSIHGAELSVTVYKEFDGKISPLWDEIKSFRLCWIKEWDKWLEISVDLSDSDTVRKSITAKSLGVSELSRLYLNNIEINTETDISREDYTSPTVLYNPDEPSASLLNRIIEKAPHYTIAGVDNSVARIQRTFSWDETSIYDAFQDIAEEIGCIFLFEDDSNVDGSIARKIYVRDLQRYCERCGFRGEFDGNCPECGSNSVRDGYGNDTTILVDSEVLGESIEVSPDDESFKTCLKLEAGDDLMTATIASCNPNGTQYLWRIPNSMREEMSESLANKLDEYDSQYEYYQNDHKTNLETDLLSAYNGLVSKYRDHNESLSELSNPIVGFSGLTNAYYDALDFRLYLTNSLFHDVSFEVETAADQVLKCVHANISSVAITSISSGTSQMTAESAVKSAIQGLIYSSFTVTVNTESFKNNFPNSIIWTGTVTITNKADEEDIATTPKLSVSITDDYEDYLKQSINKIISDSNVNDYSITDMFSKEIDGFKEDLTQYSLTSLQALLECCKGCLDVLVSNGAGDGSSSVYSMYLSYFDKQSAIEEELDIRQCETDTIADLEKHILDKRSEIQKALNFESFIGTDLWKEFAAYRIEGTYKNENYISDGLDNSSLVSYAMEFLEKASAEIYKASTVQHSISATLNNLLTIEAFEPLVDYFQVGNWIRVKTDGTLYRLRLVSYTITFNSLQQISVEFSDTVVTPSSLSDIQSVLAKANSMATSYDTTARQASSGASASNQLLDIFTNGLALTKTKLIDAADNQKMVIDSHGLLARQYSNVTDTYSDEQMRMTSTTIALTDDAWRTVKTAIGKFFYQDPDTLKYTSAYGINGEVIAGRILLGNQLGIYAENGNMTFDINGLVLNSTSNPDGDYQNVFTVSKNGSPQLYIDSNGNVVMTNGAKIMWGNIDLTDLILSGSNIKVDDEEGNESNVSDQFKYVYSKYSYIENLTATNIDAINATIENLEAANAHIENLTTDLADVEHLVSEKADIKDLNVTNANIDSLNTDVANIESLLAGSAGVGNLQVIHLTGDNVVVDDAIITDAMIANLSAGKLTAGTIYTSLVKIASDQDEHLLIDGATLQLKDTNGVVRVQVGKDASGDYSYYLWDAEGNLMWSPTGVTAAGLNDGIIRDINVAEDAAISGDKLNISSVAQKLNEDGTLQVDAGQVTIDGTKLDVAYKTIKESAVTKVELQYAVSTSGTSAPTSGWSVILPEKQEGEYIWQRTVTNYADGTSFPSDAVCLANTDGKDGEDATVLRIDSSRGTVFKNSSVSTVLSVTIYHGSHRITDRTGLTSVFGSDAYLEWSWQRMGEDRFGTISSSDKRLSNDGFSFTLTPADVDTKVVFQCQLIT